MARSTDPLLTLPDKGGVLYFRLYQKMRTLILDGHWPAGTRVPSSRRLAADLGISRNTASSALDQLVADGWIESRKRSGMFVSTDVLARAGKQTSRRPENRSSTKPPIPFELSPGAMDAFPIERWAKLQSKIWSKAPRNLLYENDRAGDYGLRTAIADIVAPARGMQVIPEQVVIVTGTQSAIDIVAAVAGGGRAVVEDPGYTVGQALLAARGVDAIQVGVDEHGLDIATARELVPNPRLILTSSSVQFPTCVTMTEERRSALLEWASESDAWVFDDDYDSQERFDGARPPPPLREQDSSRVITNVTLNRLLYRSLRLGFMIVPDDLIESVLRHRQETDEFVNLPNQLVLRQFIDEGGFSAHLRHCRQLHVERRAALVDLLTPYLGSLFEPNLNPAGLHLILRPIGPPAAVVASALRSAGIACTTLAELSRLPNTDDAVLLGFAAFSPDVILGMRPSIKAALGRFR
jgi:GntR family transcriptional regulator/MocR family aminotransferase